MTKPTIYFDLDGTLYDLYNQPNWLARITTLSDPTAYANENAVMADMPKLMAQLIKMVSKGYGIGVISWLADDSTPEYDKAVRKVKREWVKKFLPMAHEVHIVKYGTPKHTVVKNKSDISILVDDNGEVRERWEMNRGLALDPADGIIKSLKKLEKVYG